MFFLPWFLEPFWGKRLEFSSLKSLSHSGESSPEHWLPREVLDSPSLASLEQPGAVAGGLWMGFKVSPSPTHSMIPRPFPAAPAHFGAILHEQERGMFGKGWRPFPHPHSPIQAVWKSQGYSLGSPVPGGVGLDVALDWFTARQREKS